jgi:diguanylate cyclase (GGDEF)-like protein
MGECVSDPFTRAQALGLAKTLRHKRRARWEALTISAFLLTVSAAAILGLWATSRRNDEDAFDRYVTTLAEVAAGRVDPELHTRLTHPEQLNGPDYLLAVAPLRALHRSVPDIHYAYTLIWDGSELRFVLDSGDPGATTNGVPDQAGVWQRFEGVDPRPLLPVFGIGTRQPTTLITPIVSDRWGSFVVAYAPIRDVLGRPIACAGVAVDATVYLSRLRDLRTSALLGLVPAGVLITLLGFGFYLVRLRGLTMESLLAEAANKDKLTGLANRRVFMEQLDRALEQVRSAETSRTAVLFADFDRFKFVNDTMGHEAGDELLRQISERLKQHASHDVFAESPGDVLVSRFGGDEFLVLCKGPTAHDVPAFAAALLATLAKPYDIGGSPVHSTASIGWVSSDDGRVSADELVRYADMAMYEAKNRGRGCYVEFDATMRTRLARSHALEAGLRMAIGTEQLHLEYQPVIDLRSGSVVCVEALLRWQHPTLGSIPPAEFLPVAEEAGLAGTLGNWVLRESCRALAAWHSEDAERAPRRVSVNIWRTQLAQDRHLLEQVQSALQSASLPPGCLQLEIAERDIAQNPTAVRDLLRQIRDLGVRLTLDNFGSTNSALAVLRDYPFDTVKLDRTLLARLTADDQSSDIVRAALQMVETLGLVSVAQGVENLNQLAFLETLGCICAQGHFVGVPVPLGRLLQADDLRATDRGRLGESDPGPSELRHDRTALRGG